MALVPEQDLGVRGLTIDVARVESAARAGYSTVVSALRRVQGDR